MYSSLFSLYTIKKNNAHSPTNSHTERVHKYFSLLWKSQGNGVFRLYFHCCRHLFSNVLVIAGNISGGFVKRAFENVFRYFHRWSERLCLQLSSRADVWPLLVACALHVSVTEKKPRVNLISHDDVNRAAANHDALHTSEMTNPANQGKSRFTKTHTVQRRKDCGWVGSVCFWGLTRAVVLKREGQDSGPTRGPH